MRETRKSCSRRWAGNATTCQRWFRDSNRIELVVFGARDGSVARKRGRDARARDRSEREFRSRARGRAQERGARLGRARVRRRRAYRYSRVQIVIKRRVCPRKQADFFFCFRFFQTASYAVIAVFSGCSVLHRHERSIRFWQQLFGRLHGFSSPPPRSDRRSLRSFLFLAHLLVECRDRATSSGAASGAAGVSSGASRVSSRRARRGRRDGSRARRERG